jgi:cytochrome oxidase Cu insertion factor (SCO1/SenC/PrrC family)
MIEPKTMTKRKPTLLLIFLFIIFFLPMLLAWLQYSQKYSFSTGLANHGKLINPPFPISELQIDHLQQRGKWLMLLFNPGSCTTTCQQDLYQMRQIRIAMGADMDRLQRIILTDQTVDPQLTKLLQTEFAGTSHLVVNPKHAVQILQKYTLYLVDPHGNIMMSYQSNANPKDIFKDLQRLLKVSQIG